MEWLIAEVSGTSLITGTAKCFIGLGEITFPRQHHQNSGKRCVRMDMPPTARLMIGATASDGMPHGSEPAGRTTENQVTHLSTMEERVSTQRKLCADIMTEIVCTIDLLPAESTEREVLELRYLEGRSWTAIETSGGLYICHTAIFAAHNRGLDMLLEMPSVQTMLSEYRDLLEAEGKL